MTDRRAILAAANNADLYEAVFATHGLRFARHPYAFEALDPPPPYYSAATLLLPESGMAVSGLLERLQTRFGRFGGKDSFNILRETGLDTLFEATWIWSDRIDPTLPEGWSQISGEAELVTWEAAWLAAGSPCPIRLFPAALLDRADIAVMAYWEKGVLAGGCIANRSENCVGLSNVFGPQPYTQAAQAAAWAAPNLPVVGYESGAALAAAQVARFEIVGTLRVLVPPSQTG